MKQYKKTYGFQIKGINEDTHTIHGIFSTSEVDRQNEIVAPGSWSLDEYMKNPVVLWAHDHMQPAIGRMINLTYSPDGTLEGDIQFAVNEYAFANTLYQLAKGGFQNAFSVGFGSGKQEMDSTGHVLLMDNVLYEVSLVNVPANASALIQAAKSIGLQLSESDQEKLQKQEMEIEKEGRVLSAKNRGTIENAITALQDVLAADEKKSDKNVVPSAHIGRKSHTKVATQVSAVRLLNRAVKSLIKTKIDVANSQ